MPQPSPSTETPANIPEFVPQDGVVVKPGRRLVDINPGECKWCDGDPLTADHAFCGKPVKPGTSWCAEHYARVYTSRGAA